MTSLAMDEPGRPGLPDQPAGLERLLEDDPADLYENAPCGYFSALPDGRVVKVNRTFCEWTGHRAGDLVGMRFQELLTIGGRIFFETHMGPLLRMQGAVREVALDVVRADGSLLPCLVNAVELRDESGEAVLLRATVFEATSRRRYERALLAAQRAAAESEERMRAVHQAVSDLAAATSAEDVAAVVLERAQQAVRAAGAVLWLVGEERGEVGRRPSSPPLTRVAARGLPDELLGELEGAAAGGIELVEGDDVQLVPLGDRLRSVRPGLAAAMERAELEGLAIVPVRADGRELGVLVLVLGPAGDTELISLVEPGAHRLLGQAEADLLRTFGRQAGQALERVQLFQETTRQAARSAFLVDASRLMSAAGGVTETAERLAELAVPRLADICVIDLATDHGLTRPAVRHGDPARQHLARGLGELHLPQRGTPHPSVRAMREARTVWVREVTDEELVRMTRDERHLEVARALELASMVCVPLLAEGRVLGVITLGSDQRRGPFTVADVEVAEQLALQVSQVVDKAQRFELEARTSHTLQANLLPPAPPPVEGLRVAVRYLAASQGAEVGGDFYDVVPLPGEQVGLAVGDVVGHDITAAAVMGQLRSVYRALLADRPSPSAVIGRLQAGWSLLGLQRMATALFASLDPATGQLRVASAGHLPPLVISGGEAAYLDLRPSRMLGAPPAPAPADEWAGVLAPGATLLLFTDGLVESRTADLDRGLERLRVAAERAGTCDPDELCNGLLTDLAGGERDDDVALLAITRLP